MGAGIILEIAGIPLLLFVICMYFGIRLLFLKDSDVIRSGQGKYVKDEKRYVEGAAKLIFFYAGATLLMAVLLFVDVYAALAEIVVCTFAMGIFWKRMNDKYGAGQE